jgi:hypothetical protein
MSNLIKVCSLIFILITLSSCTTSIIMTNSNGAGSDSIDENQTNTPKLSIPIPLTPIKP